MSERDEILNRLRSQERQVSHPAAWRTRQRFDDLAAQFTAALAASAGEVIRAGSLDEAVSQLGHVLVELQATRVAANAEPPLDTLSLPATASACEWFVVDRTAGDLRAFCAAADVGLTGADAALAETGSIVVSSGPGRSRLVSLLPPVHIALVPTSCLTTDLFTWTADRRGSMPASLTLISGPSKTADIEQTLTIGVHGPGRLIVLLYDD